MQEAPGGPEGEHGRIGASRKAIGTQQDYGHGRYLTRVGKANIAQWALVEINGKWALGPLSRRCGVGFIAKWALTSKLRPFLARY